MGLPIFGLAFTLTLEAGAQTPNPVGPQLQVNSYTTGNQAFASVAAAPDGRFTAVWQSAGSLGTDTSSASVHGQRFAPDGSLQGAEFQVNTYTTGVQGTPHVALAPDASFVAVWADTNQHSIQGRRFAADGSPLSAEFQVNSYAASTQGFPTVAVAGDGSFSVVWNSGSSSLPPLLNVAGQRYASDGTPLGGQFQVNSYTTSYQTYPSLAIAPDGDFVVAWASAGSFGSDTSYSIQARRYASDGSPQGGQFQVNSYTTNHQSRPSLAVAADGDFVVVWDGGGSSGTDTSEDSIHGQRYASDGSPLGVEFQINSYTTGSQRRPDVAIEPGGDFVVVWGSKVTVSLFPPVAIRSVRGQRLSAAGSPQGGEFQIDAYPPSAGYHNPVARTGAGSFVVVWDSQQPAGGPDPSGYSIRGQRYGASIPVPSASRTTAVLLAAALLLGAGFAARRRA